MYNPQGVNRKSNGRESDIVEKWSRAFQYIYFFHSLESFTMT